MSDLMLHGVLNMPLPDDPSKIDLVTWVQFKDRATQASSRIEELEAKLDWVLVERDETFALMLDRAQTAEAKLAKAVDALRFYAEADNYEDQHKPESCGCCYYLHDAEIKEDEGAKARATLAELTGGKDE